MKNKELKFMLRKISKKCFWFLKKDFNAFMKLFKDELTKHRIINY